MLQSLEPGWITSRQIESAVFFILILFVNYIK